MATTTPRDDKPRTYQPTIEDGFQKAGKGTPPSDGKSRPPPSRPPAPKKREGGRS